MGERSFQVVLKSRDSSRGIGRLSHGPGILRVQKRFTGHRRPIAHFSPPTLRQLDPTTNETSSIDRSIVQSLFPPNSNIFPILIHRIAKNRCNRVANYRRTFRNQLTVCLLANMNIRYFWRPEFTANCPLRFLMFFRFNDCQGLFVTSRAV